MLPCDSCCPAGITWFWKRWFLRTGGSVHCSDEGRHVKSERVGETKREGSGEMDTGEDRDLLSSGFFDGNNDRLHNKRLIANDSSRKREGEWVREEGDITPIQSYRCHVQKTETTRCVCHQSPDDSTNEIRAWNFTKWFTKLKSESKQKIMLINMKLAWGHRSNWTVKTKTVFSLFLGHDEEKKSDDKTEPCGMLSWHVELRLSQWAIASFYLKSFYYGVNSVFAFLRRWDFGQNFSFVCRFLAGLHECKCKLIWVCVILHHPVITWTTPEYLLYSLTAK